MGADRDPWARCSHIDPKLPLGNRFCFVARLPWRIAPKLFEVALNCFRAGNRRFGGVQAGPAFFKTHWKRLGASPPGPRGLDAVTLTPSFLLQAVFYRRALPSEDCILASFGCLTALPGRRSSILRGLSGPLLPQNALAKVGGFATAFSSGFCGRRGPSKPQK